MNPIDHDLTAAGQKVSRIEAGLKSARRARDAVIVRALKAGMPERTIAKLARVTGPRIAQIKREQGIKR